ncbi:hypothetical protein CDD83_8240 [Cordyceps sp. RAO-2017]|nr:hypothetical protein CDD83_8240 [Cordyceps sp. RAO-2017]
MWPAAWLYKPHQAFRNPKGADPRRSVASSNGTSLVANVTRAPRNTPGQQRERPPRRPGLHVRLASFKTGPGAGSESATKAACRVQGLRLLLQSRYGALTSPLRRPHKWARPGPMAPLLGPRPARSVSRRRLPIRSRFPGWRSECGPSGPDGDIFRIAVPTGRRDQTS